MDSTIVSHPSGPPDVDLADTPAAPLRVTHVAPSLEFGGMERVVLDLVREGLARGQRPSVLCLNKPGTLAPQIEALGAPVLCLHKPDGLKFQIIAKLREALRELRPDVVHTHQIGALLYTGPAAKRERVPLIVHTEHIDNTTKQKTFEKRLRMRLLLGLASRHAKRFYCVSDDIAAAVSKYNLVPSRNVAVISNGIDTAAFEDDSEADSMRESLGIPLGEPVIGTVGRLNEVKRQDLLIRAFAKVVAEHPTAHLLLVGDGPEMGSLRQLVDESGLVERVHFAGYQSHPQDFMHVMDVFALTSRIEGMPLVILEAWAAGRAVIASKVGGVPKMIEDGRTGLLFDSGDEADLTDALRGLLADPDRARRMGEAGRALVRSRFDSKVMCANYERDYRKHLAARPSSR